MLYNVTAPRFGAELSSEKEGKQTQEFLATLKNLAARGVAILVLANTNKAGTNIRGRGEQSDAVDIVYEARNITGWEPTYGPAWWESLPEAGEQAWQQNTTRRVQGGALRIGFIPTKFRLANMPHPFVLEMDTTTTPWSMRDVTAQITQEGIQAVEEQRTAERQKLDAAALALAAELRTRTASTVMLKREAENFLRAQGLKMRQARNLLENGYNQDVHPDGLWVLREIPGERGHPIGVKLVERHEGGGSGVGVHVQNNGKSVSASNDANEQNSFWDTRSTGHVPNAANVSPSINADERDADWGHEPHDQCPKSGPVSGAKIQDETAGGVFCTKSHTPTVNLSSSIENLYPDGIVEAEPCLHEHVHDMDVCNDCGAAVPPWQS